MSKPPSSLYLQGGPGLNCAIERAWFGATHPILWWEQPRFPAHAKNAYQTTLKAAEKKLAEIQIQQGKPVDVIGWSFGARLALDLAHSAPNAIGTLTLLAPTLCLETAFDRMAGYLAAIGAGIAAPESPAARSEIRTGNHQDFMQRVISILSTPNLFSHYWAPASGPLFARHCEETTGTDWFDLDTFTAVSREIIKRPIAPLPACKANRIRIFAGQHDPYFDPNKDIAFWNGLFPGVSIKVVDAGHMIPFELDAVEYLQP